MTSIGILLLSIGCVLIFYQDVKYKKIHLGSIVILFTGVLLQSVFTKNIYIGSILINLIFLLLLLLLLRIYIIIKKGLKEFFINKYIGSGDIIVLFIFGFSFCLYNYILFIITSCIGGILYSFIYSKNNDATKIPLAGIICMTFLILLIIKETIAFDIFNTPIYHSIS